MAVRYGVDSFRRALLVAAEDVASELTSTFFSVVDKEAPVENGHLHQSFGNALDETGLPGLLDVRTSMLSKGSGDDEASKRGYGHVVRSPTSISITVGTRVGFISTLNDGGTVTPDVDGRGGHKEAGIRTEGQLYAPRKDTGTGFLMWEEGGVKHFARSVTWGPLGFFEAAEAAVESQAQEMGLK